MKRLRKLDSIYNKEETEISRQLNRRFRYKVKSIDEESTSKITEKHYRTRGW